MKQSAYLSKSSLDFSDKEPSRKKPTSKDYPNDSHLEEAEKSVTGHSRIGSNFDFSNFGLFFKHKASNSRSSNDSFASRVHIKKKSNETSSSRESTLKHMSSKDFSNLEELCENTTVITNPIEINPHSKKVSSEISLSKNLSEEGMDASHEDFAGLYMGKGIDNKKIRGMPSSGIIKLSREDKQEQEIMGTISKLGLSGECEELEKVETPICKDLKLPKTALNNEVIERIKSKALHHRRTSVSNNLNNTNTSMTNSNISNLSSFNSIQNGQTEMRTNNNSVFNMSRKLNKTPSFNNQSKKEISDSNLLEPFRNSNSVLFSPFEPEPVYSNSSVENQAQLKETSLSQKGQTSLLTKSIEAQELIKDTEKTATKKKPNLSTIATDSTIDSDNLTTLTFNHHNNSFSTLFSGTSNSFNNSGKIDFNSPLRVDSGRLTENLHTVFNANVVNPQPVPVMPVQKSLFNLGPNLASCYGGYGSGNNTDRSSSFSWNEEYVNSNFSSALGTPQGRQQQAFFNQNLNIAPPSFNMDHQYVCTSNNIVPQTVRNRVNSSFAVPTQDLSQSMSQGLSTSSNERANTSSSAKESKSTTGKSKKKAQEPRDGSQFEIDINKMEMNPRTTLMVKNIPNKYDLPLILQAIEKNHKGKFDFFYLPIDPRNKCNVGYAFINFIDTKHIRDFYIEFNAKKWEKFNSEKVCEIKYARIQGKKALMHHFQYSNVMNQQDKKLKPYVPADYDVQKIKDLVNKQKLESAGNGY